MNKRIAILLLTCLVWLTAPVRIANAQSGEKYYPEERVVSFDSKSHDFGDILIKDGAVRCTFTYKNIADFPIQIYNVVSSCGCTKPTWTTGFVQSGGNGKIDVEFNNTQGPFPFDKSITIYFSNIKKPVILHVRGVAHEKMKPLAERFPLHVSERIGLRQMESTVLNIEQGRTRADKVTIANIGRRSVSVKMIPLTAGLSANVYPSTIPGGSTAELKYSVDTRRTDGAKWGREQFLCQFEVDGERCRDTFKVNAFIRDDFSDMDEAAIARAPKAMAGQSYFEMGEVAAGKAVTATFSVRNIGRSEMVVRKIDCDDPKIEVLTRTPFALAPGASAIIKAKVDTRRGAGEILSILSVLTNSPEKPLLQLYITGNIK